MDVDAAFSGIDGLFDELLPKRAKVNYLFCVKVGYTLGDTIFRAFVHLTHEDRRELFKQLQDYLERRCLSISWERPHRVPRGDACVWLQSHFAIVLHEAAIEFSIMTENDLNEC